jgi:hypothetical protein
MPDAIPDSAHADGRIGIELACVNCGYCLKGLEITGKCPECGTAVIESWPPRPTNERPRLRVAYRVAYLIDCALVVGAYVVVGSAFALTGYTDMYRKPRVSNELIRIAEGMAVAALILGIVLLCASLAACACCSPTFN